MKNKIKNIFLLVFLIGAISCETTELDLTQSPNDVTQDNLDPDFLFNNIELGLNGFVQTVGGGNSYSAALARQFAMTGGNTYDNAYAPISFDGTWNAAYSSVLADINALEPLAEELGLTYHLGVSKVIKAYVYTSMVDLFGDVPFTEALKGQENLNPSVDTGASIYTAMLAELDAAINLLGQEPALFPPQEFYTSPSGNADEDSQARWITVAKTIKLRLFNQARLAGADIGVNTTSAFNDLLNDGDLIDDLSGSEDFVFNYGSNRNNPNTRHPDYNLYYEASATGYMSNYLMWSMFEEKQFDDPRLRYYFYRQDTNAGNEDIFTLGCVNANKPSHYNNVTSIYEPGIEVPFCVASVGRGYWGRDHGDNAGIPPDGEKRTVFGVYPAGGKYDDGSGDSVQNDGEDGQLGAGITPIILASFVEFYKAESALTNGTTGDPRVYLENGIRASMNKVIGFLGVRRNSDPDDDDLEDEAEMNMVENYLIYVLGKYDEADMDGKLDIIMKEFHIAGFGNGLEAYNAYRRTGKPSNFQPTLIPSSGEYYFSLLYPSNFVNLNSNATQKERTERIFWAPGNLSLQ